MQFRRSGQRDPRRRRVMIDDRNAPGSGRGSARDQQQDPLQDDGGQGYSDEALAENLPAICDLIPKRVWLLGIWLLLALGTIAGIESLHLQREVWAGALGQGNLAVLDVAQKGSIASWFGAMLLAMAAVGSLFVYSIRRYKIDDYRGRYRIWLWASAVLILACLAAATPLERLIGGLLAHMSGSALFGHQAGWWVAVYAVLFGSLILRIMLEVRSSLAAWSSLALAAAGYGTALAIEMEILTPTVGLPIAIWQSSATLLGHLGVSFSVGVYARYVFLDAQGLLPEYEFEEVKRPPKKDDKEPKEKSSSTATKKRRLRIDASHAEADEAPHRKSPAKKQAKALQPAAKADVNDAYDDDLESNGGKKLSKAEKKRLRKLKRRQQRQD